MSLTAPVKLWVLLKSNKPEIVSQATQVSTRDCFNVDDLKKAIKRELPNKLAHIDCDDITLYLHDSDASLQADAPLPAPNTLNTALIVQSHPPSSNSNLSQECTFLLIDSSK